MTDEPDLTGIIIVSPGKPFPGWKYDCTWCDTKPVWRLFWQEPGKAADAGRRHFINLHRR